MDMLETIFVGSNINLTSLFSELNDHNNITFYFVEMIDKLTLARDEVNVANRILIEELLEEIDLCICRLQSDLQNCEGKLYFFLSILFNYICFAFRLQEIFWLRHFVLRIPIYLIYLQEAHLM